jgi:hypothetical protein
VTARPQLRQVENHDEEDCLEGLGLLVGHLIGDYVVQNDWMAGNKTNPYPKGCRPCTNWHDGVGGGGLTAGTPEERDAWDRQWSAAAAGELACTVHCLLYTLAVWAFTFWWMPWWGLAACFVVHWPIDRWRLARWWMVNVSGQRFFASPEHPLFPWSIVVVDNTAHLLTLFVIGVLA